MTHEVLQDDRRQLDNRVEMTRQALGLRLLAWADPLYRQLQPLFSGRAGRYLDLPGPGLPLLSSIRNICNLVRSYGARRWDFSLGLSTGTDVQFLTGWLNKLQTEYEQLRSSRGWGLAQKMLSRVVPRTRSARWSRDLARFARLLEDHRRWQSDVSCAGPARRADNRMGLLVVAHMAEEMLHGGDRSLVTVIQSIDRSRYRLVCVLPAKSALLLSQICDHVDEIYVFPYPMWQAGHIPQAVIDDFADLICARDIRLVHANTITMLAPVLAARAVGLPGVLYARELIDRDDHLSRFIGLSPDRIVGLVKYSARWIIGCSQAVATLYDKGPQTFLLHNAVAPSRFELPLPVASPGLRVGMVSSNMVKKGIYDFVKLATMAQARCADIQFVLVGVFNDHIEGFKKLQLSGELSVNLDFEPYQTDPRECYRDLDIVVSLSLVAEAFGRTIIEAMAGGRPVICYDWGGCPEQVVDGQTGFIVPHRDLEAVLHAIEFFHRHRAQVSLMGANARRTCRQRFGLDKLKIGINQIHDQILETTALPHCGR